MRSLRTLVVLLAVAISLALGTNSFAQSGSDRIQRRNATDTGKITSVNALTVTISKRGVESKVPVEEIRSIRFAGEPTQLNSARVAAQKGQYERALETLEKILDKKIQRDAISQELTFLRTFVTAKLALGGKRSLDEARTLVSSFLTNNRSSYHLTEIIELSGDLELSIKAYDTARKNYAKLARAPSAYYKTRAAVLIGSTFQAEGKHTEALAEFDKGLKAAGGNTSASPQRAEAMLLRAISQAATGDVEQAISSVNSVLAEAKTDDEQLLAQAYNALGECHLIADDKKSARTAFLHVDILFTTVHEEHAKALYQLSLLWPKLGHPQRAAETRQRLKEDYSASPWGNR